MSEVTDQDNEKKDEDQNYEALDEYEEEDSEEHESDENVLHPNSGSKTSIDDVSDELDFEDDVNDSEIAEELAETKDQLLRAVAETENVRRRAQREKEDAAKYAIANFAREMLSISDNIARALVSERAEEEKQKKSELSAAALLKRFDSFILGVTMIDTEIKKTFERIGIEKLEPVDQPFDPKYHHALFELEAPDKPTGTVIEVVEAGYLLHERLLREAKVGVSKGGPKVVVDDTSQAGDSSEAEEVANAYEPSTETGSNIDKEF